MLLALTAAETSTIRLGSGALQMGHRTALSSVEEFGLLDAWYPGRFDLGLGRSGGKPTVPDSHPRRGRRSRTVVDGHAPNGLRIPARFNPSALLKSPRMALQKSLLYAARRATAELHRTSRRHARTDRGYLSGRNGERAQRRAGRGG